MAFNSKQMSLLGAAIDNMRDNRLSFEVSPLSIDDIMRTFIREEDRDVMQRAGDLLNNKYMERQVRSLINTTKFGQVRANIRLQGTKADGSAMYLIPSYATNNENPMQAVTAPEAFNAYINAVTDIRIDFNYIRHTLLQLDTMCAHPAHVAFFWPSVRILADYAAKLHDAAGAKVLDLVSSTTKKLVPAINPSLRAACKETAEIITAAHILGRASSTPDLRYNIGISTTSAQSRATPIGDIRA